MFRHKLQPVIINKFAFILIFFYFTEDIQKALEHV